MPKKKFCDFLLQNQSKTSLWAIWEHLQYFFGITKPNKPRIIEKIGYFRKYFSPLGGAKVKI